MTYQQTIDYLFSKLPMFSRIGKAAFRKDLTNILRLCDHLNNPQKQFKSIHVGGTNGKGSVSHMLASVLQVAGYKTGLYTSPHLYNFRERIKINGELVDEQFVIDFVQKNQTLIKEIQPSFFEITVAMAFQYFAESIVDVAVIEVGLGGRLDSTNILVPEMSVITNIGMDHTDMLGDTLEKIAYEKAGIIKENIPVVIGERGSETDEVFMQVADKMHAPVFFAEDRLQLQNCKWNGGKLVVDIYNMRSCETQIIETDLQGIYQRKNIITALQALEVLNSKGFTIQNDATESGLKNARENTGLYGRWEVIRQHPTLILEVAHNEDGLKELIAQVQTIEYNNLRIILGMVNDKDANQILKLLPQEAFYYFTHAHIPRALDANQLVSKASLHNLKGEVYDDVNAAISTAIENAAGDDLIIITGSIFLVAEVDKKKFSCNQ